MSQLPPSSDFGATRRILVSTQSQKSRIGDSITDGAYAAMMNAIRHDETPNFYFMQYEIIPSLAGAGEGGRRPVEGRGEKLIKSPRPDPLPAGRGEGMLWLVRNLLLVPSFAFPPSTIIKRKPLAPTARRAGWIGCNFALNRIPVEARIEVVRTIATKGRACSPSELRRDRDIAPYQQTIIVPPDEVRARYTRLKRYPWPHCHRLRTRFWWCSNRPETGLPKRLNVLFLDPGHQHRGVEAARICQNNFHVRTLNRQVAKNAKWK